MRILFVLGRYDPEPSANGVCIIRIQQSLLEKGILSDVISEGKEDSVVKNDFGLVYTVKTESLFKRNYTLVEKIKRSLHYPVYEPHEIAIRRELINKVVSEQEYNAIIAVLLPLNGAIAASCFRNFLIYELDSIANNEIYCRGMFRYFHFKVSQIERKLYRRANYIFHMLCHKEFYNQKCYNIYESKSEFLDIPQLVDEHISHQPHQDENIQLLYSGMLYKSFRSPEYFLELLNICNDKAVEKIEAHFYSRGDFEQLIKSWEPKNGTVLSHGYVSIPELNQAIAKADFLLSIGNSLTGKITSLPSKVISYMAYGKPIIHIDGGVNDIAKKYLKQYPYCLIINPDNDIHNNADAMLQFIRNTKGFTVPFEVVQQNFELNSPKFTAEKIMSVIDKKCKGKVEQIFTK